MKCRKHLFVMGSIVIILMCLIEVSSVLTQKPLQMSISELYKTPKVTQMPEVASVLQQVPESSEMPKATPTLQKTPELAFGPTPRPKGDIPERSYESHREFPYENIEYVDEVVYTQIKEAYEDLEYDAELKTGDTNSDEKYLEAYQKLLDLKVPFYYEGEIFYLSEYGEMKVGEDENFDPTMFTYYYFDMDDDGKPELCMKNLSTYIFKYDEQTEKIWLWFKSDTPSERIYATRMLCWDWEGVRHTLCKLDENAEVDYGILFLEEATWSNGKVTYLVTLPDYADGDKQIDITMDMKKQAYFSEDEDLYYFCVTEEQYNELTKDYFEGCKRAEEELEKVMYTYVEVMMIK